MVTCRLHSHLTFSPPPKKQKKKSQLTLSGITYPPGSRGLISITFVGGKKLHLQSPDMKRRRGAINETSNKKKHAKGGRRRRVKCVCVCGGVTIEFRDNKLHVHRTAVFGEQPLSLHNDLLYHLYIRYIGDRSHVPSPQPRKMEKCFSMGRHNPTMSPTMPPPTFFNNSSAPIDNSSSAAL